MCRLGLVAVSIAAVILLATLDIELNDVGFLVGLAVFGVGAGLLASQLGNVIISAAPPAQTNEAGGLQGTAQNLGASLGTALIGAILLIGLTNGFVERITANEEPAELRTTVATAASDQGLEVIPVTQAEQFLTDAGLPPDQAEAIAADYGAAQLDGLGWPSAGRAAGAARPVLHPQPARPVDPGGVGRRRTRSGGGTRRLTRRPSGAYTRGDGSARHRAPRVPGRAGSGRRGPRATGDPLGRRRPDARSEGHVSHGGHAARSRRDLLLPVLHAVQDRIGWISQPALNYVCKRLTIPPAEACGVATFYALFATKPRPPVVAHLCDDIACRLAGAETVIGDVERALGRRAALRRR